MRVSENDAAHPSPAAHLAAREPLAVGGLFETRLTVSNLDRSLAFYRDVVGLPLAFELPERGAAFLWIGEPGEGMLGLWAYGSAPLALSLHVAFKASLDLVARDPARVRVERHAGRRSDLRPLFEMAEDSAAQLDSYLHAGEVLVAVDGDRVVGHLQLIDGDDAGQSEIKNMAVDPSYRGRGIGRRLIEAAVELARTRRRPLLVVATGAADVGNLRFYQRAGFRLRSVERDAFTQAAGYSPQRVDGIELRDRVWFDRDLDA